MGAMNNMACMSPCSTTPSPLLALYHRCSVAAFKSGPVQRPSRRMLVCQARDKGVSTILKDALTSKPRSPDLAYQSAANYLRSVGIVNQSELNMVLDIAMNPYSVYGKQIRKQPANPHARKLSVDDDIRPVVEYLLSLGLDDVAVAGIILRHPAVLCYSVEDRLRPFVEFLVGEIKVPQEQVAQAVKSRPNMLGLQLESVKKMVGFLAASGKSVDEIAELLQTSL